MEQTFNELLDALRDKTKNVFQRKAIYDAAESELLFNNGITLDRSVVLHARLNDIYYGHAK